MYGSRSLCLHLFVLASIPGWAADPVCPGFLRTVEVNGPAGITGIDAKDNLAVTADNHGLSTWDLSDPTKPTWLGSWGYGRGSFPDPYDYRNDVYLHPSKTWACLTPVFDCFDLRDPSNPQPFRWQTSEWPAHLLSYGQSDRRGTAFSSRLVAARHFESQLARDVWLLDVSTAGRKEWMKPAAMSNRFLRVEDLAFMGDYLVVVDLYEEFAVFDVTDPKSPIEVASIDIDVLGRDFHSPRIIAGDHVVIVYEDAYDWEPEELVVDLRDPSQPVIREIPAAFNWWNYYDITLSGDHAIATVPRYIDGLHKLFLEEIDFSDPAAPRLVAQREITADWFSWRSPITATNDVAVGDFRSRLSLFDRSAGLNEVGATPTHGRALNLSIDENLGVLANGRGGISTLDLSDPHNPVELSRIDLGGDVRNLHSSAGIAIAILPYSDALVAVDVNEPHNPALLDSIEVQYLRSDLAVSNGIAIGVSDYNHWRPELWFIDTSDPTDLRLTSQSYLTEGSEPGQVYELRARNQTLFVPTQSGTLFVLDFSNPDQPTAIGEYPDFAAVCVDFHHDHAVFAKGRSIDVVDISDPSDLQVVHTYDHPYASHLHALSEDLLAIAGNAGYLANLSELVNPVIIDAPPASRGWSDGALIGTTWLRPSGHVIDVVSLECLSPEAEIRTSGRGPTIWFEDLSRYQVTERTWDFGDGETSRYLNPVHTYPGPGNYTVTLTVSSPNGADTSTEVIEVGPIPVRHQPPGSRRQP